HIDAFSSAGNTGAMLVGAVFSVKTIPGVLRPAMSTNVPQLEGGFALLVDVGANADCKPEYLPQFAVLGSLFAEHVYNMPNPRVALINIGEEEEKGNMLCQAAYPLMKESKQFNFVGNIEGYEFFSSKAEVF